jgi:hypothetical protein
MLKHIMHPGDSLARDEAGERFDGGAAASWATRSHRMFTAHSVAVAATRTVYRAACRETRHTKTPSSPHKVLFSPPSAKFPHKYSAHNTRNTSCRSALMSNRVA